MTPKPQRSGPILDAPASATETSIRQLIANGKSKAALDSAKDHHKAEKTGASETLLVEAYAARIRSLLDQNLVVEAKSLLDLVGERFPSAKGRLEELRLLSAARGGSVEELLRPLLDPGLSADQRAAIEAAVQNQVHDLAALAACAALPAEHSLRRAAAALQTALIAVTSGPVAEAALSLPEVSHRSPLAPWKLLVRAIACYYRGEDDACREYLNAIQPDAAAARLIPAMQAMSGIKTHGPLTPAARLLAGQTAGNLAALRSALDRLDRTFDGDKPGAILAAVQVSVKECREIFPAKIDRLKQLVSVRCALIGLDRERVSKALGGPAKRDAAFLRLYARGMEQSDDPEELAVACGAWDEFRQFAVKEGWFKANGSEAAELYLHMARVLQKIPGNFLPQIRNSILSRMRGASREDFYFLFPEKLYERACAIDPHFEAFSQWLAWAKQGNGAERVAEAWHRIRPMDLEPVLFLMEQTAQRQAFQTALQYLDKAERIDGLHPSVRQARLRLLTGNVLKHLQQKKPHLAAQRLEEIQALPQSQQGDRPAMLAALRWLICAGQNDQPGITAAAAETELLLQSRVAAELLVYGAAVVSKRNTAMLLRSSSAISPPERTQIPAALARVVALVRDMQGMNLNLPLAYLDEAAGQIPRNSALDTAQLQILGEAGVCAGHGELAYAASTAGLQQGSLTEPSFLLLRAQALPSWLGERRAVCAAAAVELARKQQDQHVLEKAVQILHNFAPGGLSLNPGHVDEVVRKEKETSAFPTQRDSGPDYSGLIERCDCPACRRKRGQAVEPWEEEDEELDDIEMDQILDELELPPDMPPEVAAALLLEAAKAVESGETLDDLFERISGKRRKKGRRR